MYQNPPLYVPGPPVVHQSVTRRRPLIVLLLLPFLLFGLMFFGGSYAMAPDPDIEVQPGFAFVDADVLLVPYERHGVRGMFQSMTQDLFQVRLAAIDPATGESLWDTQLSDQLVWAAAVLAGGQRHAYLATDAGLVIVAMADGAVVAEGAGVAGLGDAFLTARNAYAYDPEGRRVLAMTAAGDVLAIPLDQVKAEPVDSGTAAAWSGRLSAAPAPAAPPEVTAPEVVLAPGGERVALRDLPFAGLGQELVRVTADGWRITVGGTAFHGAVLVVAGGAAVGAASGHVLVQHQRSVNDTGTALSTVRPDTVQVTDTLAVEHAVVRAVIGPDGTAAVATGPELVLVNSDGLLTRVDVGATDFFGSPS
jgi:hypothetical protein